MHYASYSTKDAACFDIKPGFRNTMKSKERLLSEYSTGTATTSPTPPPGLRSWNNQDHLPEHPVGRTPIATTQTWAGIRCQFCAFGVLWQEGTGFGFTAGDPRWWDVSLDPPVPFLQQCIDQTGALGAASAAAASPTALWFHHVQGRGKWFELSGAEMWICRSSNGLTAAGNTKSTET